MALVRPAGKFSRGEGAGPAASARYAAASRLTGCSTLTDVIPRAANPFTNCRWQPALPAATIDALILRGQSSARRVCRIVFKQPAVRLQMGAAPGRIRDDRVEFTLSSPIAPGRKVFLVSPMPCSPRLPCDRTRPRYRSPGLWHFSLVAFVAFSCLWHFPSHPFVAFFHLWHSWHWFSDCKAHLGGFTLALSRVQGLALDEVRPQPHFEVCRP